MAASGGHVSVPYAKDQAARVVDPADCPRDGEYRCLTCNEQLTLKRGEFKRAHFAHSGNSACVQNNAESVIHAAFKNLFAQRTEQFRTFSLRVDCAACETEQTLSFRLSPDSQALTEYRIGPYRADVAIVKAEVALLALEVLHTHAVDPTKAEQFAAPWFEVRAHVSVLLQQRGAPHAQAVNTNWFRAHPCPNCLQTCASRAEAAELGLRRWKEKEHAEQLQRIEQEVQQEILQKIADRRVWNRSANGQAYKAQQKKLAAQQSEQMIQARKIMNERGEALRQHAREEQQRWLARHPALLTADQQRQQLEEDAWLAAVCGQLAQAASIRFNKIHEKDGG